MENQINDQVLYCIEQSKRTHEYTLLLEKNNQKKYILGKYTPRQAALDMLPADLGNKETVWFLIGFGFGYILRELISKVGKSLKAIVYEPDEEILNKQLLTDDFRDIQETNVKFISGDNWGNIKTLIDESITENDVNNVKVVVLEGYEYYYTQKVNNIVHHINMRIEKLIINFNTKALLKEQAIINCIRSRYAFKENCNLEIHYNKYKNIPALIVSAGPSLAKNIKYIKHFKGIVFVMGRTLTATMEHGCVPDFVACVDYSDEIIDTFNKHKEYDTPLIAITEANWKVIKNSQGPKYILNNNPCVNNLLGIRVNPVLSMCGSVATLCLSSAYYMGCDPIVFIGQDLAFEENVLHSELTTNDEEKQREKNIVYSKELKVKGYNQEIVYTNNTMYGFLSWIENFIKEKGDRHYINATEGGACIEGTEQIEFKKVIEMYCMNIEKPIIKHERLNQNDNVDVDKNISDNLSTLQLLYIKIESLKELYSELLDDISTFNEKSINKKIKKISRIEKDIIETDKNKLLSILMENISLAIASSNTSKEPIHETPDELKIRKVRINFEVYEALESECKKLINIIEKEIEYENGKGGNNGGMHS